MEIWDNVSHSIIVLSHWRGREMKYTYSYCHVMRKIAGTRLGDVD